MKDRQACSFGGLFVLKFLYPMKLYFGFGANRDPEMITAITGKKPIFGFPAILKNFELVYQSMNQIPKVAQKILKQNWANDFVSYAIKPNQNQEVCGTIWFLTNKQRAAISLWELNGLWSYKTTSMAEINFFKIKIPVKVETEIIHSQEHLPVSGKNYKTFIVPKNKILETAILVRNLPVPGVIV
ncbi:MAG: hypothetical protein UX09_C0057G0005 [Candidatus Uhrbacteria bacterium GW2011_GWE2_45_35]|uniref:Uncharacterized protein n=2 Tax=Candidatus Uhriibacteriota TaxID=1752732 RepID=A0A0G1JFP1_9BACT|nr:MAG: hypothetical protein UW63_C0036G0006 [Candidatus Uhrbacteria bacterium GW2011_GWF2_44_350]KKU06165.1 MAG: hypothetical protein UX09_C0057G0005 [Candidatus Uhrbacteria bacterium GW2011_GWE2_45_35]HBR80942.1 hypothetical protein [Candidatus Uhrbacteria bacterium]HCU31153.1 hypothetical protein [Candidatus Uhrbacteria bacterium]